MRYNLTTNHRLITGLAAGLTFASAMAMAPSAVEAGGSPTVTPFAECQNGSPVMGFEVTNGIGYTYYLGGNAFVVTTSPTEITMPASFDEPTSATMSGGPASGLFFSPASGHYLFDSTNGCEKRMAINDGVGSLEFQCNNGVVTAHAAATNLGDYMMLLDLQIDGQYAVEEAELAAGATFDKSIALPAGAQVVSFHAAGGQFPLISKQVPACEAVPDSPNGPGSPSKDPAAPSAPEAPAGPVAPLVPAVSVDPVTPAAPAAPAAPADPLVGEQSPASDVNAESASHGMLPATGSTSLNLMMLAGLLIAFGFVCRRLAGRSA